MFSSCHTVSSLGTTNCGTDGVESLLYEPGEVEGGTYYRTYDIPDGGGFTPLPDGGAVLSADGGPTNEADPASVSTFRLDKYLVTVGRFRAFVNAWNQGKGYLPTPGSGKHTHSEQGGSGGCQRRGPGTLRRPGGSRPMTTRSPRPTRTSRLARPIRPGAPRSGPKRTCPSTASPGRRRMPSAFGTEAFCRPKPSGNTPQPEGAGSCPTLGGRPTQERRAAMQSTGASTRPTCRACLRGRSRARAIPTSRLVGDRESGRLRLWSSSTSWFNYQSGLCIGMQRVTLIRMRRLCVLAGGNLSLVNQVRVSRAANFSLPAANMLPSFREATLPTYRDNANGIRCARIPELNR